MNPITGVDTYKFVHPLAYPKMESLYGYFESRGGVYPSTIFYGLQGKIKNYLSGIVFDEYDIQDAEDFVARTLGRKDAFPKQMWEDLYHAYGGELPLKIKAVPEGTLVPTHNVLFTVESTDERFAWLVPYFEDIFVWTWYPTTVATQSFYLKKELKALREQYSDNLDGLEFMVHDFGYRGVAGEHAQAGVGGSAHLLSFRGTDTTAGIYYLDQNYNNEFMYNDVRMFGYSIPATEHSVMMTHDSERDAVRHYLKTFPEGTIACVADTTNVYEFVKMLGTEFRDDIINRKGTLVVRPDSGEPTEVVPAILNQLAYYFGGHMNTKGKFVLDPHVRVIWGDGMNRVSIPELYKKVVASGFAPENLTVGVGGGMLQDMTRDTNNFAFKVSEVKKDGVTRAISKNPITDPHKKSKKGRLVLMKGDDTYTTTNAFLGSDAYDELQTVFENGTLLIDQTYDDIVRRIEDALES